MTALVPVEGNPFAQPEQSTAGLVPVQGNPFDTTDHRAMQDRIDHGNVASRMLANMASSAKEGFGGEHVGFEPGSEAEQFWKSAGLLKDNDAIVGPLVRGGVAAGDLFMRAIKGAVFTGAGAVEQIVKENGGDPHHLKYELADAAMFAMNAAPMAKPTSLARVRKLEDGTVRAERIGEMAKPEDFPAAAEMLRESAGPEAKTPIEPKLRSLYEENGIHPSEVLADAAQDPTLAKRLASDDPVLPPEYTGVDPVALKAEQFRTMAEDTGLRSETIREMPGVSPELSQTLARRMAWPETPAADAPPSAVPKLMSFGNHISNLIDRVGLADITRDLQLKVAPMAERNASAESRAAAKDWASTMRVIEYDKQRLISDLKSEFTPERRAAMWKAADERHVKLHTGDKTAKLEGLSEAEAHVVEQMMALRREAWGEAQIVGLVDETNKGLEHAVPRIVTGGKQRGVGGFEELDVRGRDFAVSAAQLNRRKYLTTAETEAAAKKALGDEAYVVQDIATVAIANANLMRAVAGRRLINQIEELGRAAGKETVFEGSMPVGRDTFSVSNHPSFWKSKRQADGTYERVQLYVDSEFKGPLEAILQGEDGAAYSAMMALKAKSMNYIMWSPLTHNMVIYGRAFPEFVKHPIISGLGVRTYVEGYRLNKYNPEYVRAAIQDGMSPIGRGGVIQDIKSLGAGDLHEVAPQYSIEARILGAIPDLFNPRAGTAVKATIDKMGDVMHNTFLWDRVFDLQVGMHKMQYDLLIKRGVDHGSAMKQAGHLANRFAGALPVEEMSGMARKTANILEFSRSFTLGNIGALKDMFTGYPRSVLAQIERDHGVQAMLQARSFGQRKNMGIIATDAFLFYAGNSILQSAFMAMNDDEGEGFAKNFVGGYVERFNAALAKTATSPMDAVSPFATIRGVWQTGKNVAHALLPQLDNEPGKTDRALWGYDSQGTAQYLKNPFGKVTEDQIGWGLHPMQTFDNKMSPMIKPLKEIQANQTAIGKHVYNPYAATPPEYAANAVKIAQHLLLAQVPGDTLATAWELLNDKNITPDQKRLDTMKLVGQISGFMVSQGAQGGPAGGELLREKAKERYAWEQNGPDVRKAIKEGRIDEATAKMTEIGIKPRLQQFFIQTTLNPSAGFARKAAQELRNNMAEEDRQRFDAAIGKGRK